MDRLKEKLGFTKSNIAIKILPFIFLSFPSLNTWNDGDIPSPYFSLPAGNTVPVFSISLVKECIRFSGENKIATIMIMLHQDSVELQLLDTGNQQYRCTTVNPCGI